MPAPVSRHQCKRPFKHTEETCEHIRMEEQVEHIRKELLAAQKVIESFDNQLISGETKEEISDENKSTEEKDADENVQKLCSQLAKSSLTEETRKHDVEERLTEMINYFKVVGFPKLINEKISINIDEATRSVHKLREFYPELTETIFIKFMKVLKESLSCQQFYDKIFDDDETSKCYDATLKFFEKVMSTEWSEEDLNSFKKKNFEKYGLNVVGAAYLFQMTYPIARKLIQWYQIVLIMDNKIAFRSCGGTVSHAIRMMNSHFAAPQYLTEPSGEVKSDGHPKSYENNQYKVTYIEIELDQRVIVSVLDFDLDEEDSLTIYDGGSVTSRILIKWSGTHENQAFLSTSNLLTVVFRTDDAFYGRGFVIHYESWSKNDEFYHSSNDVIASPNYPDYYPFFTENAYLIDCPEEENRIIFNITDISISSNDYLSFFEGPSTSDNHILRINGNNPSTLFFRSSNGTVLITFTSEETRKRHSGWQLEYHCVPLDGLGEEIII